MKKKFIFDVLILFSLGALSSLSLPPLNFFIINFFTFSILFIFLFKRLVVQNRKKLFFLYGWLFGFGYFLTNIYWITISLTFDENFNFLIPIALIIIPVFLGLFYGFATLIFCIFNLYIIKKEFISSIYVKNKFKLIFVINNSGC